MILLFKFMIHVLVWSASKTVTNDMLSCLAENTCLIFTTLLLCCCLFNACVPLNKLPFDSMLHCVFYMIRKNSSVQVCVICDYGQNKICI